MWIVYYDDEMILDVVSSYENLVNYFNVFRERYPMYTQIRPIPNISEEGKFVAILKAKDITIYIVRMLPRSEPSFAFEFD